MKIKDYLKILKEPLKPRVVCFLIKDNQILLGYKKRGFGKGNYCGIGGKIEKGESIEEGLIREVIEEINVKPLQYQERTVLNAYFPYVKEPEKWNQKVYAYIVTEWEGEISESEEIRPEWFDINEIPYKLMWSDNKFWLPQLLKGQKLEASFTFDKNLEVDDYEVDAD